MREVRRTGESALYGAFPSMRGWKECKVALALNVVNYTAALEADENQEEDDRKDTKSVDETDAEAEK